MQLAEKIVNYMKAKNYQLATRTGEKNIIYIEGMDRDGTLNPDTPNHFNDLRLLLLFDKGVATIEGAWEATTEPGYYYTDNPMNPNGAARIAFGQYRAWQVGLHGYSDPHEALIQVGLVKVHRDWNRDMIRTGDAIDEGYFGINQHHGWGHPKNDIHKAGAGCFVGRDPNEHFDFMDRVKSDSRYIADPNFVFPTTIIPGDKL
ncbi:MULTISPECIES: hypothetical protein [unclassified Microcoleus]|uniref:hypothetical protein n=1 Tax=unclassified Microcoleus TaxID=2642155 RepID=UPI002FD78596